jgi:hypothetical protein
MIRMTRIRSKSILILMGILFVSITMHQIPVNAQQSSAPAAGSHAGGSATGTKNNGGTAAGITNNAGSVTAGTANNGGNTTASGITNTVGSVAAGITNSVGNSASPSSGSTGYTTESQVNSTTVPEFGSLAPTIFIIALMAIVVLQFRIKFVKL